VCVTGCECGHVCDYVCIQVRDFGYECVHMYVCDSCECVTECVHVGVWCAHMNVCVCMCTELSVCDIPPPLQHTGQGGSGLHQARPAGSRQSGKVWLFLLVSVTDTDPGKVVSLAWYPEVLRMCPLAGLFLSYSPRSLSHQRGQPKAESAGTMEKEKHKPPTPCGGEMRESTVALRCGSDWVLPSVLHCAGDHFCPKCGLGRRQVVCAGRGGTCA
jgi:hypothetical protein